MKIERFCGYDEFGCPSKTDFRIMRTTCPKCKEQVEFIMQEDDFIREDRDFLEEQNLHLKDEILRLNKIINKLIYQEIKNEI